MPNSSAPSVGASAAIHASSTSPPSVGSQIQTEIRSLSSALAAMFDSLPSPIWRASDLTRVLNVESSLASRIYRVARAAHPGEAIESLPTLNQFRRVVARVKEVSPGPTTEPVEESLNRLDALMQRLGDQRDFESLASMHVTGGVRRVELAQRRAAFRANSHLWGRTVECLSSVIVLVVGKDGDSLDGIYNFGYVNARILNPRQRFVLGTRTPMGSDPASEARRTTPELLPEFSDISAAALTKSKDSEGFSVTEIQLQGEDPATPQTIVTRQLLPRFASLSDPDSCFYNCMATWPAGRMHMDIALPAGLGDASGVLLEAFAHPKRLETAFKLNREDEVALHEQAQVFLDVDAPPSLPGLSRVPEIFRSSLKWAGLENRRFDIYRCDVECPMLHSVVSMRIPLRAARG